MFFKSGYEKFSRLIQRADPILHLNAHEMKVLRLFASFAAPVILVSAFIPSHKASEITKPAFPANQEMKIRKAPRIQAAILLDVSSSMDGLINQAKLQLWNMVSVMARGDCNGLSPEIELALYEYGRQNGDSQNGYMKQLSPFTKNLDALSTILFGLTTYGGLEYCGQVIYTSLDELNWDKSDATYKVIFIAGNEDFLQGSLHYTKACQLAAQKSVIVNTIYCGPREQGIREHWNLNGECGSGSFTNINQNASLEDIPTPYDSILIAKNNLLNHTYMGYGNNGATAAAQAMEVDRKTYEMNKSSAIARTKVKASAKLYNNSSWDLVDAMNQDENFMEKLDKNLLPDSLKNKSPEQIKAIIKKKSDQREAIQKDIIRLSAQRDKWLTQKRKEGAGHKENTLQSEVEKIICTQALKYGIKID